ncbi:MAG: hypothetical protein HY078_12065 [Elusimicrobia bacterium]|nr:hypothetical protein [Elusimicrobiota bacterium]
MNELAIDKDTGVVSAGEFKLGPDLTPAQWAALPPLSPARVPGYLKVAAGGKDLSVLAMFPPSGEVLLTLCMADLNFDEDARKVWHDGWLAKQLGRKPPYKYAWGEVVSQLERRSGVSVITVAYPRRKKSSDPKKLTPATVMRYLAEKVAPVLKDAGFSADPAAGRLSRTKGGRKDVIAISCVRSKYGGVSVNIFLQKDRPGKSQTSTNLVNVTSKPGYYIVSSLEELDHAASMAAWALRDDALPFFSKAAS